MTKLAPHLQGVVDVYGDGTFGHQHTRERCADVLAYYANENFTSRGQPLPTFGILRTVEEIVASLRSEMSDDATEEYAACDWLNEFAPFTGASWDWRDDDFGLWPDVSEDDSNV